jgi:hypothetical protein
MSVFEPGWHSVPLTAPLSRTVPTRTAPSHPALSRTDPRDLVEVILARPTNIKGGGESRAYAVGETVMVPTVLAQVFERHGIADRTAYMTRPNWEKRHQRRPREISTTRGPLKLI